MATKYHYEVYIDRGEEEGTESLASFDTYEEAKKGLDKLNASKPAGFGKLYSIDKWRTVDGLTPESLGECVDGDLEASFYCDVCGEELFEGDRTYMTTGGTIIGQEDAYIDNSGEEFYTTACKECGKLLSKAICEAVTTIAKQRGGGE